MWPDTSCVVSQLASTDNWIHRPITTSLTRFFKSLQHLLLHDHVCDPWPFDLYCLVTVWPWQQPQLCCSADLLVMVGDNAWQCFCVQPEKRERRKTKCSAAPPVGCVWCWPKRRIYFKKRSMYVFYGLYIVCVVVALLLLHAFVVADAALLWCCPEPANWK